MRLIVHDLPDGDFERLFSDINKNDTVISAGGKITPCTGCFGCWVKTPGQCVIKDGYGNLGELMARSDEAIYISECTYGGLSPFVKNVIDRSISFILPYFALRNGEIHHRARYKKKIKLKYIFYGDISKDERETAEELVKANAVNLNTKEYKALFFTSKDDIGGALQ